LGRGIPLALLIIISLAFGPARNACSSYPTSHGEAGLAEKSVYAWYYDPSGKASYERHRSHVTHNCPVWYGVSDDLSIIGPTNVSIGPRLNKLIPCLGDSREDRILEYLRDPKKRELLAKNICDLVVREGFDGINIDIEFHAPNSSYRRYFTALIADLSKRLHAHGKFLSVDVPAKASDAQEGWCGAFDYRSLGIYADHLVLMAYDYSTRTTPPGPIAPTGWIGEALDYALSLVDRNKIVLGIPFYGYDWFLDASGKWRGEPITYEKVRDLIRAHNPTILWNRTFGGIESNEPYFRYEKDGVEHIVFFQNSESIRRKLDVADSRYVRGIAIWHLGGEDEGIWEHIEAWRSTLKISLLVSGVGDVDSINLEISGTKISMRCGSPKELLLSEGEVHLISVDKFIQIAPGIRYFCQRNIIRIPIDPPPYVFEYKKQYRLLARSPFGNVVGSGWYEEGSIAHLSINHTFPLKFKRWSGSSNATSPSVEILMDGPKEVVAVLEVEEGLIAIFAIISAFVILLTYLRVRRRRCLSSGNGAIAKEGPRMGMPPAIDIFRSIHKKSYLPGWKKEYGVWRRWRRADPRFLKSFLRRCQRGRGAH